MRRLRWIRMREDKGEEIDDEREWNIRWKGRIGKGKWRGDEEMERSRRTRRRL
jgi:hypothetical protein